MSVTLRGDTVTLDDVNLVDSINKDGELKKTVRGMVESLDVSKDVTLCPICETPFIITVELGGETVHREQLEGCEHTPDHTGERNPASWSTSTGWWLWNNPDITRDEIKQVLLEIYGVRFDEVKRPNQLGKPLVEPGYIDRSNTRTLATKSAGINV
jgi:hypothetical protein